MIRVLLVFGTRPEAIKMCPLIQAAEDFEDISVTVCVTGQHREMLDQVLDVFGVTPDYDLSIMREGQTLTDITRDVLLGMEDVLREVQPDIVLVHGDTTTSFAAALAAFYQQIPVGHVEAGLRTRNLFAPWPEEFNRQAVDIVSRLYFAPTEVAKQNLLDEQKPEQAIFVTGNTVIDALQTTVSSDYTHPILEWVGDTKLILVTAHRHENLGEPLRQMMCAIRRIADEEEDVRVVYPVHLNPLVREVVQDELGDHPRVMLVEPLDVLDFHNIMARSYLVMTDSGGIQEEAPSLGKPVLVMRDTTERPEGVAAGTLKLVGSSEEGIYRACRELLHDEDAYKRMSLSSNPYGDGRASRRILKIIVQELGES